MNDHGPDEQMKQYRDSIRAQLRAATATWRTLAAGLGPSAREVFREYEAAARDLETVSNSLAFRLRQLAGDDLTPEAGKQRLASEAREKAAKQRSAARRKMADARTILAAKAYARALPKLDPKREQAAREELRLLTDNAPDTAAVLLELAQRDDELAGVAVSSYAESMLRARGTPKAKDLHAVVRDVAVEAAAKSADPERQTAAAAYAALGELDRATACAESVADAMLEDSGVELG